MAMTARAPDCTRTEDRPRADAAAADDRDDVAGLDPAAVDRRRRSRSRSRTRSARPREGRTTARSGSRDASCTTMCSENAPSWHIRLSTVSPRRWRHVPSVIIGPATIVAPMSQMYWRPERQNWHFPHDGMKDDRDVVAGGDARHALAYRLDDARALVAADRREHASRAPVSIWSTRQAGANAPVAQALVGIAHARRRPSSPGPRARGARRSRSSRCATARSARLRLRP